MTRYIALVDIADDAFGASFPDLPGCVAMGETMDEVWTHAVEALNAWIDQAEASGMAVPRARSLKEIFTDPDARAAIREGAVTMATPVVREEPRAVRVNMSLDASLLALIDATAERVRMTRSGLVEALARRHLAEFN